jgi:hypothetical protein
MTRITAIIVKVIRPDYLAANYLSRNNWWQAAQVRFIRSKAS